MVNKDESQNARAFSAPAGFAASGSFQIAWLRFVEPYGDSRPYTNPTYKKPPVKGGVLYVARAEGFEPPTAWFVARYSIQLSYARAVNLTIF